MTNAYSPKTIWSVDPYYSMVNYPVPLTKSSRWLEGMESDARLYLASSM